MTAFTTSLVTILLVSSPTASHAADPKPTDKPNVLIILVDDMGWGDPQCFNPHVKSRLKSHRER